MLNVSKGFRVRTMVVIDTSFGSASACVGFRRIANWGSRLSAFHTLFAVDFASIGDINTSRGRDECRSLFWCRSRGVSS